jgi:hypothetical protein
MKYLAEIHIFGVVLAKYHENRFGKCENGVMKCWSRTRFYSSEQDFGLPGM